VNERHEGVRDIDTNKELNHRLFLQRESEISHSPYENELEFYELVREGNIRKIDEKMAQYPISNQDGRGTLSDDPVRNILYHFIVSVAMISRFCMEGGLDAETAYSLSDLYIQKGDRCTSISTLTEIHQSMCRDFATRMGEFRKKRFYSRHVLLCTDYIYENLQKRITVRDLAKHVKRNESYLSVSFRAETGKSISEYIREKKIEAAQNMLKYADFSCLSIANYLAFSSQSHFIKVFKDQTGLTPASYRKKVFRTNWSKQ